MMLSVDAWLPYRATFHDADEVGARPMCGDMFTTSSDVCAYACLILLQLHLTYKSATRRKKHSSACQPRTAPRCLLGEGMQGTHCFVRVNSSPGGKKKRCGRPPFWILREMR